MLDQVFVQTQPTLPDLFWRLLIEMAVESVHLELVKTLRLVCRSFFRQVNNNIYYNNFI